MQTKDILLLGTGYIGSSLFFHLKDKHRVACVDLEWRGNPANIPQARMDYANLPQDEIDEFDTIILVAAHASAPACNQYPYGAFKNNVVSFIDLVKKSTGQKLIYASSSCVYTTQMNAIETCPLTPTDSLSFTKTTIDHFCQTTSSLNYYGLRFGSVSGPSPNLRTDLAINAMVGSALKNNQLTLSNGHAHRPFLGMRDLVRAVELCVNDEGNNKGIYNVASFNSTFREIADSISRLTGASVQEKPSSPTYDFTINTDKFNQTFGFKPEETIESLVNDHRQMLSV